MDTLIFCLLAIALVTSPFQETEKAQSKDVEKTPSAKKIIDKYVLALGGYEELESRTSIHWRANGKTSDGETFVFEAWQGAGKYACRFERSNGTFYTRGVWSDGSLDENKQRTGFAWEESNGSVVEKTDEELQEYLRRRTYVTSAPTWLRDCKSVKCIGVELVHDKKAYRVEMIDHNDTLIDLFFDAESGLLLRRVCIEAFGGTTQEVIRDRFNYKKIGNTMVPMKETISWRNSVYVYENEFFKVNEKLAKGTFGVPAMIQKKIDALQNSRQPSTVTSTSKDDPKSDSKKDAPKK